MCCFYREKIRDRGRERIRGQKRRRRREFKGNFGFLFSMAAAIASKQLTSTTTTLQQPQTQQQQQNQQYNLKSSSNYTRNGNKLEIDRSILTKSSYFGENFYKLGDLVWAKVNVHPWWPCRISKDINDSYFRLNGANLKFIHILSCFIFVYRQT